MRVLLLKLERELGGPGDGRAVGIGVLHVHCRVEVKKPIGPPSGDSSAGTTGFPSPEAIESPIETIKRSFTWMVVDLVRGFVVPASPLASSFTLYFPCGRLRAAVSPVRCFTWSPGPVTVQLNVEVGRMPVDWEASSVKPYPPGGLTYARVLGRSGSSPWAGSSAICGSICQTMTGVELSNDRTSRCSTVETRIQRV